MEDLVETLAIGLILSLILIFISWWFWKRYDEPSEAQIEREESIAKKKEEIFIPNVKQPLDTEPNQSGMLLLRRLRDEAHRFAITFHRQKRSQRMKRSQLNEIPGLGPQRIKLLLEHFRSIEAIQMASLSELSSTPGLGTSTAVVIRNYFHPDQNK